MLRVGSCDTLPSKPVLVGAQCLGPYMAED